VYQTLLTRRYLTHRVMPWLAMVSVAGCCLITILTWSIMGGFLDVFRGLGRKIEGDVSITWPTVGFGYYEELIQRLETDPAIEAAAPVITTFGLIGLPDDRLVGANIQGVDERYAKVSSYADALWWKPLDKPVPKDTLKQDPRLHPEWPSQAQAEVNSAAQFDPNVEPVAPGAFRSWEQMYKDGVRLQVTDPKTGEARPAAVPGIELGGFYERQPGGWYLAKASSLAASRRPDGQNRWGAAFLPARSVTITVLPLDKAGRDISTRSMKMPVANEFRMGFFEVDQSRVLVHLSVLQKLLKMEAGEVVQGARNPYLSEDAAPAASTGPAEPARVTKVLVKGKPGHSSAEVRERCLAIYKAFAQDHAGAVPSYEQLSRANNIATWEQNFALFIGQVEKETVTVLMLLLVVSLVCTVLILSIFWSMVSEKTKDIGILRSVGCSRGGVAGIWLAYGLMIGVVGSMIGLVVGCEMVWNINPIHDWLGSAFGISVWDPRVYFLPEIPNKVVPERVGVVVGSAIVLSLLGALIPAARAANMDPVRALRFE